MALPQPQFINALLGTLEDPVNQTAELATALRNAADTYSEAETDEKIQEAIDALPTSGDVTGPAGAVVGNLAVFDNVSGKVLADSLVPIVDVEDAVEKAGFITVTQPVDLDAIETRVNQLDAAVVLKGTWDASAGTFPGGGTAQAGDSWIVSVGGTAGGVVFTANDRIIAITDNAPTTVFAANWFKADYTDLVQSVNGQTGAVTIEAIISAAAAKTAPDDADIFPSLDSSASFILKKWSWANLKAAAKTYFDTLYGSLATTNAWSKGQRAAAATALSISGGTVTWNLADGNYRELSVTGNFTLNLPSDVATYPRQSGYIEITNTGAFTMSVAANISVFNSALLPTIAQGSGAKTLLTWCVNAAGTEMLISLGGWGAAL